MPNTVRSPAGLLIVQPEFGQAVELPTLQCVHCGGHWVYEAGSGRPHRWCMNCAGPTCSEPHCIQHCVPEEKRLEEIERRWARATRSWA